MGAAKLMKCRKREEKFEFNVEILQRVKEGRHMEACFV